MILEPYIKEIKSKKEEYDSLSEKYESEKWLKYLKFDDNTNTYLDQFKESPITREAITNSYRDYFESKNMDAQCPFILTMIWGFGNSGYGPYRTSKYVGSTENGERINSTMDLIEKGEVERAFYKLKEIDGLGISFASKVLYFASKGKSLLNYPLIFDIRVAKALIKLHSPNTGIHEMIEVLPKNNWKTYNAYNEMVHNWSREYNIAADHIELFLFDLDKNPVIWDEVYKTYSNEN